MYGCSKFSCFILFHVSSFKFQVSKFSCFILFHVPCFKFSCFILFHVPCFKFSCFILFHVPCFKFQVSSFQVSPCFILFHVPCFKFQVFSGSDIFLADQVSQGILRSSPQFQVSRVMENGEMLATHWMDDPTVHLHKKVRGLRSSQKHINAMILDFKKMNHKLKILNPEILGIPRI